MVYFMFSKEQYIKRVAIEKKAGRIFSPGFIIVDGNKKLYTEMNNSGKSKFSDSVQVASAKSLDGVNYTKPKSTKLSKRS